MAINTKLVATLLLLLLPLLALFQTCHGETPGIAVYWGQDGREGTLTQACTSGLYSYVIIAFIFEYGGYQPPSVNLAGHCTPSLDNCKFIGPEITTCQNLGVKVLISIGGPFGGIQFLTDPDDAIYLADYIYNNFLGGSAPDRLFGDAVLDGVDFYIERQSSYLADLARHLHEYSTPEQKVYLSAAPQCPFPDLNIGTALNTGLFDYVWIQFYNNPSCQYSSNSQNLIASWITWTWYINARYIFVGLPGSPEAPVSGYATPAQICYEILPYIRRSLHYGGVMIWSRYWDKISSDIIKCVKRSNLIKSVADY
ncbi:hevamine-A-like [Carica papaya]|uniref:hevamine-A-like n=1 Tax=Carica papaya TaxID=3649 RepID=UPI000B8D111A|nr:hevamine-A-like [Carica papaya]